MKAKGKTIKKITLTLKQRMELADWLRKQAPNFKANRTNSNVAAQMACREFGYSVTNNHLIYLNRELELDIFDRVEVGSSTGSTKPVVVVARALVELYAKLSEPIPDDLLQITLKNPVAIPTDS